MNKQEIYAYLQIQNIEHEITEHPAIFNMEEMAKVRRVIQKAEPSGPHETLLVLDANFGQNALTQVKAFDKAIDITGLVVTKLDRLPRSLPDASQSPTHSPTCERAPIRRSSVRLSGTCR